MQKASSDYGLKEAFFIKPIKPVSIRIFDSKKPTHMKSPIQILSILLSFLFPASTLSGQVIYYQNLITELETEYNLTGGEYVIGGNENLLDAGINANVTTEFNDVTGQIFERSARMSVTSPGPNQWSQRVTYQTISEVEEGDILLLTAFIRNHGGDGISQMAFSFQEANSPWTPSTYTAPEIPNNGNWYRVFFPFDADLNHPVGETILQLHLGFEVIDFEIGGLAVINFKQQYSEDDLPKQEVFYYEGIDPDAPWRQAALDRIETHRKSDLEVTVLDANGVPIPNAEVHVEMQNPLFRYGTVDEGGGLFDPNLEFYQQEFFRLFNFGSVGVFWGATDWDDYASELATANLMLDNGFDIRITPVLWGTINPIWSSPPPDVVDAIQAGNADYVRQRIDERLEEVSTHFGDIITDFEVLNEPTHVMSFQNLLGPDEYLKWFETMRNHNPNGQLSINDFEILSFGAQTAPREAYKTVIENMLINNTPLDGVGFQSHMFDTPTPPERVYNVLEEFAQLGHDYGRTFDMKITEYDTDGMGDQLAAKYLEDFMIAMFSHPQISTFVMWGFWDGRHWLDDAPLYNLDLSPKPALATYENLVFNEWWTDENLTTDSDGKVNLRGFKGDYLITVSYDGQHFEKWISLTEDSDLVCTLDDITSTENLDLENQLVRIYPTLAKAGEAIFLENLAAESIEKIEISNALGQVVFAQKNIQNAFSFSTQIWAKGVYYLKVIFKEGKEEILKFEIH